MERQQVPRELQEQQRQWVEDQRNAAQQQWLNAPPTARLRRGTQIHGVEQLTFEQLQRSREQHAVHVQRAFEALVVLENLPPRAVVEAHERLASDPLGPPKWGVVGPAAQSTVLQQREGGVIYRIEYTAPSRRPITEGARSSPYAFFPRVEAPWREFHEEDDSL